LKRFIDIPIRLEIRVGIGCWYFGFDHVHTL
jgi:hypothetical protein